MDIRQTLRFRVGDDARSDIQAIANRYDALSPSLGATFINEVARILALVAAFPNAYVRVYGNLRKVRIGRFPYFAACEVFIGEFVVIGVFAETQNPDRPLRRPGER
jgi:plasmid stabilization system protein ParE